MHSQKRFAKTFDPQKGLPFEQIRISEGNTMKFTHGGIDFTIVNVA